MDLTHEMIDACLLLRGIQESQIHESKELPLDAGAAGRATASLADTESRIMSNFRDRYRAILAHPLTRVAFAHGSHVLFSCGNLAPSSPAGADGSLSPSLTETLKQVGGVHAAKVIRLMHTVRLEYERQLWDPDALSVSAHDQPEAKLIDYGGVGFLLLDGDVVQSSATVAKSTGSQGSGTLPSSLSFLGSGWREVEAFLANGPHTSKTRTLCVLSPLALRKRKGAADVSAYWQDPIYSTLHQALVSRAFKW